MRSNQPVILEPKYLKIQFDTDVEWLTKIKRILNIAEFNKRTITLHKGDKFLN